MSGTVRANSGGHNEIKILEPCIGAIRGRNPENPKSRKVGEPTQQMLEIKTDGTSNILTTVQKDNVVGEPGLYQKPRGNNKGGKINDGKCPTITSNSWQENVMLSNGDRIRKLTPLECWRLMGFGDTDHQKAVEAGVSNSQRYKQAGNSIVVDVLEAIFGQMM